MISARTTRDKKKKKVGQDPLYEMHISAIRPSPENDALYKPIDPDSSEIKALAKSIKRFGLMEPIVITLDGYIVSGHRRYAAALLAGLKNIPCRVLAIRRTDDIDHFVRLLREYNRQREKDHAERLREEVVSCDPHEAYRSLIEHRQKNAQVEIAPFVVHGAMRRKRISKAKLPMLNSIEQILDQEREYWPISGRRVHYLLLNDPPLVHASKRDSTYANDKASYKKLMELLTRARLTGQIPMEAIGDETRPIIDWDTWSSVGDFIGEEINKFLKGYWRKLMQSQPCHFELLVEKNTIAPIIRPIAAKYCIPMISGRGYSSLPPRYDMLKRFEKSGKEKLVLIVVSDFDPEGEDICNFFALSMRDDFGLELIHPIKAALSREQAIEFGLPMNLEAKKNSSRYNQFVSKYGTNVWEVDALETDDLQRIVTSVIDSVIDIDLFNKELDAEKQDAGFLEETRRKVQTLLAGIGGPTP